MKKANSELTDWGRPEYKRADLEELVRGRYAKLSKAEREKVELEYHQMKPEDFDAAMSRVKLVTPAAVSRSKRNRTEKKRAALTEQPTSPHSLGQCL